MLSDDVRQAIEAATVRLPDLGGQGVLVTGGLILTACHCVKWNGDGRMALGDHFVTEIETRQGERLRATPLAVEPVADIAVLGALDNQAFSKDALAFEDWCERTGAVRVAHDDYPLFEEHPVYVLTHTGPWIRGPVQLCRDDAPVLSLQTDQPIKGGTSGGPIVDGAGRLVGVVSIASDDGDGGMCPRPHLALPVWVSRQVLDLAQRDSAE